MSLGGANLARRRHGSGWVSHAPSTGQPLASHAHRGEGVGWGIVLQRRCTRLLLVSGALAFTYASVVTLPYLEAAQLDEMPKAAWAAGDVAACAQVACR